MNALLAVALPLLASRIHLAHAQTTNATCRPDFDWMINSRGQSPCLVAAYVESACDPTVPWNVVAIPNSTVTYAGPTADIASPCTCSSVTFSLLSACAFCQGDALPSWLTWIEDCPADDVSNGQFPLATPDETVIPTWAYQQIAKSFNVTVAENVAAAARPTPSSSTPSTLSSSTPASSGTSGPTHTSHSPPLGALVGGIVGGVVGLLLIAGLAVFFYRRSKRRAEAPLDAPRPITGTEKPYDSASMLHSPWSPPPPEPNAPMFPVPVLAQPMRLYDPEDPSTFPPVDMPEYTSTRVDAFLNAASSGRNSPYTSQPY